MGWCSNLEGRERWEKILGMGILRGPVVHTPCFHCRKAWVRSLVGEPGSSKSQRCDQGISFPGITFTLPVRFAILCIHGMRKLRGRSWQEAEFQTKGKYIAQAIACSRVRAWISRCVCGAGICTLHLYASHSGRRRKEKCCFYISVNTRLKRTFLTAVSLISPTHFCYSSNQYTFIEHLLGIWHCDRHWDYMDEQERHSLRLQGVHTLWRRQASEWEDAILRQGTWIRIGHGGEGVTW